MRQVIKPLNAALAVALLSSLFIVQVNSEPLTGRVSNKEGRIGIREDWDRKITRVYKDSPAEKAGLKVGDKVIEVDGHTNDYPIIGPVGGTVEVVVIDSTGLKRVYKIVRVYRWEISSKY